MKEENMFQIKIHFILCLHSFSALTSRLLEIQIAGSSTEDCNRQFNEYLDVDPVMQICAGDHKNNEKDACQVDMSS